MKINLKKLLIISSSITLSLGLLHVKPVFAEDNLDTVYEEEISKSIIAGDGSAENPYVLDSETSPLFTEYLQQKGREALSNVIHPDNGITTFGILDGVLSGTAHYYQNDGGYWVYGRGAPNVGANGNIWMEKVEYISKSDVIEMCSGFTSSSVLNTFKGAISGAAGKGLTAGIDYLVSRGLKKSLATAMAKWIGCGSTYIAAYILLEEISTFINQKPYLKARDAGKGLIHAVYKTSYQGQWYNQSLSETWGSYPTAKEPMSYYGIGGYTSR